MGKRFESKAELIAVSVKILNMSYIKLSSDEALRENFISSIKTSLSKEAGEGVLPEHVSVSLSPGSVVVNAKIIPPAVTCSMETVMSRLASSVATGSMVQALLSVSKECPTSHMS